ncbi:NITRATE FORMATE IRON DEHYDROGENASE [Salix koriyanagi]|uniref:CASP-like protein n=1 Tax=Salix koriyanagi TaxID=2511006 RepID=A0A9Q0ZV78_9ROSI|nr:NITRATE FORMATE IRON DEHYDROGENASE [Salix koriyanagi]
MEELIDNKDIDFIMNEYFHLRLTALVSILGKVRDQNLLIYFHTDLFVQMMAYLTLSAVAAAAQSAAFAKLGQTDLQWMKICNMYGKFCNQVGEGIASAVLVSVSMVVLSCISCFSLFRLYGGNKDAARW